MALVVVVGLGSNVGDRLGMLRAAVAEVRAIADVERTSRVYESAPVGPTQPDFLNAAALVRFDGAAEDLLDAVLAVEARLGRVRAGRWGPRTIDLDLLWAAGGITVDTPRLVVPHPELRDRAFALVPLLEIVPGATDPRSGLPYVVPPGDVRATAWRLT